LHFTCNDGSRPCHRKSNYNRSTSTHNQFALAACNLNTNQHVLFYNVSSLPWASITRDSGEDSSPRMSSRGRQCNVSPRFCHDTAQNTPIKGILSEKNEFWGEEARPAPHPTHPRAKPLEFPSSLRVSSRFTPL